MLSYPTLLFRFGKEILCRCKIHAPYGVPITSHLNAQMWCKTQHRMMYVSVVPDPTDKDHAVGTAYIYNQHC